MPSVDISAQHSKAEKPFFGLDRIAEELIEHPLREHIVVARVIRSGLTVNDARGSATPRIRPLHIEVIVDPVRQKEAIALLDAEYRSRTGRAEMPPSDLFNGGGDGQLEGQTTVEDHIGDDEPPANDPTGPSDPDTPVGEVATDPTAGPHGPQFSSGDQVELWPGDEGYQPPKA